MERVKYIVCCFFCLFVVFSVVAQENKIDNNIAELKNSIAVAEGIQKLELLDSLVVITKNESKYGFDSSSIELIDLAISLDSFDLAAFRLTNLINFKNNIEGFPEKGIELFNNYFGTLKNKIKPKNLATLYIDSGDSYYFLGDVEQSMSHYDKAIEIAKKPKDKRIKGVALLYKGYSYSDHGEFVNASQVVKQAINIFIEVKDTFNIIASKNALSILYSRNAFYEEAKREREEAIHFIKESKSFDQLVPIYFNASFDYQKLGDDKKVIESLLASIEANKNSKFEKYFEPKLLGRISAAYAQMDSISKAEYYLKKMEISKDKWGDSGNQTYYLSALKYLSFAKHQYKKSLEYGRKHLEMVQQESDIEQIQNSEKFLAKVYELLGDSERAYLHFKKYKTIQDSIFSVQKTKALSFYQTLYETEKRDAKISSQNASIAILNSKDKLKNQWMILGTLILLSLFLIVYLFRSRTFVRRQEQMQKAFSQDLIKNVEQERKRISSDLHDSIGQSLLLIKNKIFLKDSEDQDLSLVNNAIKEVREISQSLHPFQFEKLGLIASLKNTIQTFQKNSEIFYSEEIEEPKHKFPKEKEIFIYRMIQEVLNNVEKHSKATACKLTIIERAETTIFEVKDNGIGFDVTDGSSNLNSLGMKTLKERAQIVNGQLLIDSTKDKGTIVQISVPRE